MMASALKLAGSAVKLACAALATLGPFIAGSMFQGALTQHSAAAILLAGICVGLGGLFGYVAFETAEEARYQRHHTGRA